MRPTRYLFLAVCLAAAAAASVDAVRAESVFVANSANGRITVFDASTGAASPFAGDTSSLVKPLGIRLDAAGGLIVCDNQRGRIVRYGSSGAGPAILAADVPRPDGPSFGGDGSLFFVTSPDGATSSKLRDLYMLPGGSGPAVRIATLADSRLLRDTAVVPAGPYMGQLLVLSQKPAFIARFSRTGPATFVREAPFVASVPGEPTGMGFTPDGDLLVSGIEGIIRRYDASGNQLSDFASGLGTGPTRLAVGGDGTVYVTNRNRPALFRFDASGTRLSDFGGSLQSPAGVATHGIVPTPTGQNVTVSPIPEVVLTYDNVVVSGFTSASRFVLPPGQAITPCGNVIPEFAALPAGDTGFQVFLIDTTAGFTDTIFGELFHADGNTRAFHAPCPPEMDAEFEDVTVAAMPGDPRTNIPRFSEFLIATDTRPNSVVIQEKLQRLVDAVADGTPGANALDDMTIQTIRTSLRLVSDLIAQGDEAGAIQELQNLKAFVRAGSGTTIPNMEGVRGGNLAGTLISGILTLIFSLGLGL
jgi:hypothetical protein